jgi:acyl-CoA oxidase
MPLLARTYALDFAIHDAIRGLTALGKDTQELELRAAALKAAASQHAVTALQYSRELCGGQGYLWANRIGELRADTDVFTTFEGANNVLLLLVAKGLLTELREDFEEMRVWATVKEVTARAGTAVAELNPVITRKTDEEHLRDPEFHMSALRYREQRLLRSAAARMRHLLSQGRDAFVAVNECELHLLKLAEAHADVLALEAFQQRVARAVNSGTQQLMTQLCTLFALSVMEDDRGWFLESGYIEPAKSKAIRTQVVNLCHQLHQYAELIVDGWGIPARYLPEIARQ